MRTTLLSLLFAGLLFAGKNIARAQDLTGVPDYPTITNETLNGGTTLTTVPVRWYRPYNTWYGGYYNSPYTTYYYGPSPYRTYYYPGPSYYRYGPSYFYSGPRRSFGVWY